jgi:predicted HTH domain antitoxin
MTTIELELDDAIVTLLKEQNQPLEASALELMVLELYRRGEISSGKAAELLGIRRIDFIRHASQLGIPFFNITTEELDAEVAELSQWRQSSSATPAP